MTSYCTIYYILAYIYSIPQIIKLLKRKSSNDYRLLMVLIQYIALCFWFLYIFTSKQSIIVYIGTVIDFMCLSFIDILILKYYKFESKKEVN